MGILTRIRELYKADPDAALELGWAWFRSEASRAFWHLRLARRFKRLGRRSAVVSPRLLTGTRFISIGDDVTIRSGSRIEAIRYAGGMLYEPSIDIGDNCFFEFDCQITSASTVSIGHDVLFGGRVLISDNNHGKLPGAHRLGQPLDTRPIRIGNFVWLGQNVCVLAGSKIGDDSVVAAGSIVTSEFGPRAILAGIPAKQIGHVSE